MSPILTYASLNCKGIKRSHLVPQDKIINDVLVLVIQSKKHVMPQYCDSTFEHLQGSFHIDPYGFSSVEYFETKCDLYDITAVQVL